MVSVNLLRKRCIRCPQPARRTRDKPSGEAFCRPCRKTYTHEHYVANKTRYNAAATQWAKDHPAERRAAARRHWEAKGRDVRLRSLYGITAAEYAAALVSQGGRCAICATKSRKFHTDHDHVTGRFRGLLCNNCNWALGLFADDPDRMRSAASYVEAKK